MLFGLIFFLHYFYDFKVDFFFKFSFLRKIPATNKYNNILPLAFLTTLCKIYASKLFSLSLVNLSFLFKEKKRVKRKRKNGS